MLSKPILGFAEGGKTNIFPADFPLMVDEDDEAMNTYNIIPSSPVNPAQNLDDVFHSHLALNHPHRIFSL